MSSKFKVSIVAVSTAALFVSSFAVAQASPNTSTTIAVVTNASSNGSANSMGSSKDDSKILVSVLAALVIKGTITQAQSDSITAAFSIAKITAEAAKDAAKVAERAAKVAERAAKYAEKAFERASKALRNDGNHSAREALIGLTLGIDVKTLHARSKAGESLATIAGVKKDALIAALVLDQTKRIDAFVAAGKITAAQATILKAGLVINVTAEVNAAGGKNDGHHKGDKINHMDNDNN